MPSEEATGACFGLRRGGGVEGISITGERTKTVLADEGLTEAIDGDPTSRIPPLQGLQRMTQLWHFVLDDNLPFERYTLPKQIQFPLEQYSH